MYRKMDRKQIESYLFCGILILSALLFILLPAQPASSLDFYLNRLVDDSVFANGYYQPSNYPFAAKITNAFSVILAVIPAVPMGVWRRNGVIEPLPKTIWLTCLFVILLGYYLLYISTHPQEYSNARLNSEEFYNNPIFFLIMLSLKSGCIYCALRAPISLVLYTLKIGRKPE